MKKPSKFTLSFICVLSLQILWVPIIRGQNYYKPFINTNKQWNVMNTSYAYGGSPATRNTMILHISASDTLINDTLYQKVVNIGHSETLFTKDIGFIREDMNERKVFFREETQVFYPPQDKLLYDFSLETGDTTEVFGLHHCTSYSNTYTVVSTGTIQLLNGAERKTWHLEPVGDNVQEADLWIEGIGSIYGMLFPACSQLATISFSLKLLCYYENDIELYRSDEDSCFIDWTSGLESHAQHSIKLFPNPATGQVQIELPDNIMLEPVKIELHSPIGRLLYNAKPTSHFHKIDVAHFPAGLYLVRLWDGERWRVQKLVKY